jgi:hypothetical protein
MNRPFEISSLDDTEQERKIREISAEIRDSRPGRAELSSSSYLERLLISTSHKSRATLPAAIPGSSDSPIPLGSVTRKNSTNSPGGEVRKTGKTPENCGESIDI